MQPSTLLEEVPHAQKRASLSRHIHPGRGFAITFWLFASSDRWVHGAKQGGWESGSSVAIVRTRSTLGIEPPCKRSQKEEKQVRCGNEGWRRPCSREQKICRKPWNEKKICWLALSASCRSLSPAFAFVELPERQQRQQQQQQQATCEPLTAQSQPLARFRVRLGWRGWATPTNKPPAPGPMSSAQNGSETRGKSRAATRS